MTIRTGTPRALDLAQRTHELSDFLVNVLKVEDVGARFEGAATYHMACHLRGLGHLTEPIRLMQKVRGLQFVPLERYDECCGFGGSFAVRYPGISGAMVHDKVALIEKTGAETVVATDAGFASLTSAAASTDDTARFERDTWRKC